ncbi:MAG: DHH family phosphoesterase [archaeon]
MLKHIELLSKEFLEITKDKPIRIISHYDTDGITSAAILARAFKRLDKKFSIRIVKSLDKEIIDKELLKQGKEVLIFSDLGSGSLDYFKDIKYPIFIFDHHEIDSEKLHDKIKIINPHLFNISSDNCTGAGTCYFFAKALSPDNADLSSLALIGMIGDRHEKEISKVSQQIIEDTKDLTIKKGIMIYPATRPLRRALEYSTSPYIPGITGNGAGVLELLRETGIQSEKSLLDLNEQEISKLVTAIIVRCAKSNAKTDIVGNLYILKFFNRKEDVRELSVLINACSRLGYSDTALAFCMENEKARIRAQDIYTEYKQELISGLKVIERIDKIQGNGFVILNAKDEIKDVIVGTVCSMLSSSMNYDEGTVLIGMAYNKDKIKVSARIAGHDGRNLKEVLEKTVIAFKQKYPESVAEFGGHHFAAGCVVDKVMEEEFISFLKTSLEIEVVKI